MNTIEFKLHKVSDDEVLFIDGVGFKNALLVEVLIDGKCSDDYACLNEAVVVFSELERSLQGAGRYLIFTAASGIADEGAWEGVDVSYSEDAVLWEFSTWSERCFFSFNPQKYKKAIEGLGASINDMESNLVLEPSEVFFPESWE